MGCTESDTTEATQQQQQQQQVVISEEREEERGKEVEDSDIQTTMYKIKKLQEYFVWHMKYS